MNIKINDVFCIRKDTHQPQALLYIELLTDFINQEQWKNVKLVNPVVQKKKLSFLFLPFVLFTFRYYDRQLLMY